MYFGFDTHDCSKLHSSPSTASPVQMEIASRLYLDVDEFLGDDTTTFADKDWATLLASKRLTYNGE